MDAFGFMALIVLMWAWGWPEKVGVWFAKVQVGFWDGRRNILLQRIQEAREIIAKDEGSK